jgi:hypothetical protein
MASWEAIADARAVLPDFDTYVEYFEQRDAAIS